MSDNRDTVSSQTGGEAFKRYVDIMLPLLRPSGRWSQGPLRDLLPPSHQTVSKWRQEALMQRNAFRSITPPSILIVCEAHELLLQALDAEIEALHCLLDKAPDKRGQWDQHLDRHNKLMTEFVQQMEVVYELSVLSQSPIAGEDPCPREKVEAWEKFSGRLVGALQQDSKATGIAISELARRATERAKLVQLVNPPPCLQVAHSLFVQAMDGYSGAMEAAAKGEVNLSKELGRRAVEKVSASAKELSQVKAQKRWR